MAVAPSRFNLARFTRDLLLASTTEHSGRYPDRALVRALAEHGLRGDAIDFCNKLRSMPSMEALYKELMP